ncbi:hypothetical protein M422DRAFT_268155 [Sphaerobolus stellatus SS14]|uniref:Protein kinase domain-containing protein n=1 Tax=Sphaerobolus stellatus (strain SS14) TaxID=990650 RepID=A0A0C9UY33_SPHS4|nr:hypothetical protein M422DRAFT_268155 [Sphaerobolus stellatus SS14]
MCDDRLSIEGADTSYIRHHYFIDFQSFCRFEKIASKCKIDAIARRPPEVHSQPDGEVNPFAVDIWQVGFVIHSSITREFGDSCRELVELSDWMMQSDPEARPSAAAALKFYREHRWRRV